MVKVPTYEQNVSERPIFQQGIDVRATPEAFGADIGRGMQSIARGGGQVADAMAQVRDLEDTAIAKERDNSLAEWDRNAKYGDGGLMTLSGKAAVEARPNYEKQLSEKQRELSDGLSPGAAQKFKTASDARLQSSFQSAIVHAASERKTWFKEASASRVDTFANDALVSFGNPALVTKNIAAGQAEIRQQGALEGWDADTLKSREEAFVSGVHKNITLRMAQDDPIAADKYMKDHADQMTGAHQYELKTSLETEINNEQSKREADAILGKGRKVRELPGDIVGEVAAAGGGRALGSDGPSNTRAFLMSRLTDGKGSDSIDGLDENFATNVAAMIQDAPPNIRAGLGIYSGFRSVERQEQLWNAALTKYGSADAARKWVAPPGHSQHNHGQAMDLAYNGQSLKNAPQEVVDWVHQNAGKYGLYFPLANENWHIEPIGSRSGTVAPRSNNISPRSVAPSYDEIEDHLASIPNEKVRDLTRKRIYAQLEAQSKAVEASEKQAKATLWQYVDQGATPDQVPMEVRQAAGMEAVSSAWSYIDKAAKGRDVESDETLLYSMRKHAASNPTDFAGIDLNDYRDRLSKEAIKELTGLQTTALTDQRKAREDGLTLTTAFSQAQQQLEAVGITMTDKKGSDREAEARRISQFQNALAEQMAEFKKDPANNGRNPNQLEIQSMVNRLLLPIVIKTPRAGYNPAGWFGDANSSQTGKFLFEAGSRPDGAEVDVAVSYADIPIDLRRGIRLDMERELGRTVSDKEVAERYETFVLNR